MVVDNLLCLQACSFLLSNPDSVDYNGFYDACVTLLAAGTKVDIGKKDSLTLLVSSHQGFMQDQVIASHTCFGGHSIYHIYIIS